MTLVLYGLWWYKPQGIAETIEIDFRGCENCQKRLREARLTDMSSMEWTQQDDPVILAPRSVMLGVLLLVTGVYIAIDALGWDAYFPTGAERMLWRLSVCAFGLAMVAFLSMGWVSRSQWSQAYDSVLATLVGLSVILGALARLVLTIEAFAGLRAVPVGIFNTTSWSAMLPHIG